MRWQGSGWPIHATRSGEAHRYTYTHTGKPIPSSENDAKLAFFFLSRNQSLQELKKLDSTEVALVDFVDPIELVSTLAI